MSIHPFSLLPLGSTHWALLAQFNPPIGLVYVGAGTQLLPPLQDVAFPHALVLEANAAQAKKLAQQAKAVPGVEVLHATVAEKAGTADFFAASNPFENGLLDPAHLIPLWRGLKATGTESVEVSSLDTLCAPWGRTANWLWVDCLPAASILTGAKLTRSILEASSLTGAKGLPKREVA